MSTPKNPKSPEEKLEAQQRSTLNSLCNRILGDWSFKKLKTWYDVYKLTGMSDDYILRTYHNGERERPVTYPELQDYLHDLKISLETQIWLRHNPPDVTDLQRDNIPKTLEPAEEVAGMFNDQDYGWFRSPKSNPHAYVYWAQKKAIKELYDGMVVHKRRGQALLGGTGTGKTYVIADLLRKLLDIDFAGDKTWGHIPYLVVTRATVVEQTRRVLEEEQGISVKDGVEVVNIELLRSRAGQVWIKEELKIESGQEKVIYHWKKNIQPCVIIWDECQALKNEGSIQHEIACAYNDIEQNTYQIFASATPFLKVAEAKCFCVATRKPISDKLGLGHETLLTNTTWPTYASSVAYPAKIDEYVEAATARLRKDMEDYIVQIKGMRPQFDAVNSIKMLVFQTKEESDYYHQAWERYLKEKAKLEAEGEKGMNPNSRFMILVQFLKFRMAAEYCRRYHLAKAMHDAVNRDGKAAVAAVNFKGTIIAVVKILVNEYGVPRDKISLIWGGGQTQLTKKMKAKQAIQKAKGVLEAAGESVDEMLESLDLDEVEDRVIEELDPSLRLGIQTKEERQREIDRFQSGRTLYCFYTFRAGGVGLSLHHTDTLSKVKVRRQKNGYAFVDDISRIPIRPRRNHIAPTWSPIELIQGVGRCPRLTSLSDTEQYLMFYSGTIEERVADIANRGLRCAKALIRVRESWQDMIIENNEERIRQYMDNLPEKDNPDELDSSDESED